MKRQPYEAHQLQWVSHGRDYLRHLLRLGRRGGPALHRLQRGRHLPRQPLERGQQRGQQPHRLASEQRLVHLDLHRAELVQGVEQHPRRVQRRRGTGWVGGRRGRRPAAQSRDQRREESRPKRFRRLLRRRCRRSETRHPACHYQPAHLDAHHERDQQCHVARDQVVRLCERGTEDC